MSEMFDLNSDAGEQSGVSVETLAETENYQFWRAHEPDGEITYHIDLDTVTLHFFEEEWREFLDLLSKGLGPGGLAIDKNKKRNKQ